MILSIWHTFSPIFTKLLLVQIIAGCLYVHKVNFIVSARARTHTHTTLWYLRWLHTIFWNLIASTFCFVSISIHICHTHTHTHTHNIMILKMTAYNFLKPHCLLPFALYLSPFIFVLLYMKFICPYPNSVNGYNILH